MSIRPTLTQRDHAILSGLAKQNGLVSAAYYKQLTDKLRHALIINVDAVEPELATIGSFLRYRVNGARVLEHKLVLQPERGNAQHALSIKTPRGLGLLGMWQDETITLAPVNQDRPEVLELEMVLFQPEADGIVIRPGDRNLSREF